MESNVRQRGRMFLFVHHPRLAGAAIVVAAFHFWLCLNMQVSLNHSQGETWGWFPIFLVDFPFSILLLFLGRFIPPIVAYGVGGSIWWFAIVYGIGCLFASHRNPKRK